MFRQGDVLIVPVDSIPESAKPVKRDNGRVVLAYGEVTGHAHALRERRVQLLSENGSRDICYLRVSCPEAFLRHEEHREIRLPAGNYKIVRQREYTPEAIRNVAD